MTMQVGPISFPIQTGRPIIPVEIGQPGGDLLPMSGIIDTGATCVLIDKKFENVLDLEPKVSGHHGGVGGPHKPVLYHQCRLNFDPAGFTHYMDGMACFDTFSAFEDDSYVANLLIPINFLVGFEIVIHRQKFDLTFQSKYL